MKKENLKELTFVGRPFVETMMDDQKTFTQANAQMENDEVFKKFLKDNQLENQRASMVIFGPENFMYWYGVTVEGNVEVPAGLMKFALPAAEVAKDDANGQINAFDVPLNFVLPKFFEKVSEAGFEVYENPGDSETPYFVQNLDLDTKKLAQMWYLKASK
ncbi:GyrI-like domain-containing protein [Lactobacillus agrestimuris]|uniref:GyrI-like domain-containing protein n=1 Tax=Lactobacillus agrestimuris TaxID=2941328 RepID=UPI002043E204|nr:GyrI-like domain-containing protein [Lactobacillus agrestimuris]